MKGKFNALQIGFNNLKNEFSYDPKITWHFFDAETIERVHMHEQIQLLKKDVKAFDLILVEAPHSATIQSILTAFITPYNTVVDHAVWSDVYETYDVYKNNFVYYFNYDDQDERLNKLKAISHSGQYGDKLEPKDITVNPLFKGKVHYFGNKYLVLEDDFGSDFKQVATWKFNAYYEKHRATELWLEFVLEEDVAIEYAFRVTERTSGKLLYTFEVSGAALNEPVYLPYRPDDAHISISLRAKGTGIIKIGAIHRRWSRLEFGEFFMGGKRFSDDKRDEFIYYFHPGDMKPPLNVYFSGYRTAEGFEGFFMMNRFKAPFLLIGDPRIEGGAFYLGTEQYEQGIIDVIQTHLKLLNFSDKDLILSGLSMGSFGALYYGAQLKPSAVIVGKPLVSIGTVAHNIRLLRPTDFGTSLDVLLTNSGDLDKQAIDQLNQKFWQVFEHEDVSDVTFGISYMEDDDYDLYAYDELLKVLSRQHAKVMGRGIAGRHNDDSPTITNWFVNFYNMILQSKFGR
ncbi:accessory Sec system protein Asp2 [Macrococcus capreoli]|uniref:accessory Sec system protein Asp2 n=1 Tax=Macrococcus capreoli TaxID=2982690 RepID=UPI0021D598D1|nr:accessory Sec system protein Asp2 [Macrococcus sp. TMW 2.2395]MCU7558148.1 accessory Sec system protein Asp2 [Macrococcus sp. TMW 2.2395]